MIMASHYDKTMFWQVKIKVEFENFLIYNSFNLNIIIHILVVGIKSFVCKSSTELNLIEWGTINNQIIAVFQLK